MDNINYTHEWLEAVAEAARSGDEMGLEDLGQWLDDHPMDEAEMAALRSVLELATLFVYNS